MTGISVSQSVYSMLLLLHASFTTNICGSLRLDLAASTPVVYCTAKYGMTDLARDEIGDKDFDSLYEPYYRSNCYFSCSGDRGGGVYHSR